MMNCTSLIFFRFLYVLTFLFWTINPGITSAASLEASLEALHLGPTVLLKVHNVGTGNLVTVEVPSVDGAEPEYMIIDAGSRAYKQEIQYFQEAISSGIAGPATPPRGHSGEPPASEQKHIDPVKNTGASNKKIIGVKNKQKIIGDIRISLGDTGIKASIPINIKTVVISHPDSDHYGWLLDLFTHEDDHIEHLILGGWPCHYSFSSRMLEKILDKGTTIYFPAIMDGTITPTDKHKLEEILKLPAFSEELPFSPHSINLEPYYWDAPSDYALHTPDFLRAFQFQNTAFRLSCLSVNASHYEEFGRIISHRYIDDDNADSIVLKLIFGDSSAIITGDATFLTEQRILRLPHSTDLKTNVLISSHHGSAFHGSNHASWILATSPEYILNSSGHQHGHPSDVAYSRFKGSPTLKKDVTRHSILLGKSLADKEKQDSRYFVNETSKGIFSTLMSGTITVNLPISGHVALSTKLNGHIIDHDAISDDEDEVDVVETKEGVEITPQKGKTPSNSLVAATPFSLPSDSAEEGDF